MKLFRAAALAFFLLPAVSAASNPVDDILARAATLKQQGDAAGALAAYREAAALEPQSASTEDEIGFLLVVLNRRAEAIEHFQKAMDLEPAFAPAHFHMGVLYWLNEDPGHSIPQLDSAVALDQKNLEYRLKLGDALNATGHYDEALLQWKAATKLNPQSGHAWNGLGLALQEKHDLKAAADAFQQSVDAEPDNLIFRGSLGAALVNTRRADEGIAQFRKILEQKPNDPITLVSLGSAFLQKGDLDGAIREFRHAIQGDGGLAIAHYNLGVALKSKDDFDAAQSELERAVQLEPALAEGHYTLGILAWQKGDAETAARQLQAAIDLRPEYAEAWTMLGTALRQKGDLAGAESALRHAILLNPENPGAYNTLGQILRTNGDIPGSRAAFAEGARIKQAKEAELGKILKNQ